MSRSILAPNSGIASPMYMKTAKSANVGRLATRGRSAVGNPSSYYPSPGWLRIDPNFAPLKGNPRFERLVAGK